MRSKLVVALLPALVVMVGCGGSKSGYDGPVVPWIPSQPSELAERAPVSTPCKAADLNIAKQVDFEAYGNGGGIAVVALQNKGSDTCRLDGSPRVELVKPDGPKQVNKALQRPPVLFPDTAYPLSSLHAIKPGEYVGLTLTWFNWCDPQIPGKTRTPPTAVRITLPNGTGHVDADYNAVPPCSDPRQPSEIGVSPFETAKVKPVPPWTSEATAVTASIANQPVRGKPGELLHYVVVLKNTSRSTVGFDRCPSYVQQLVPMGQIEVHDLNCKGAKPIAPGKTEAFAMQIRVPKNAPAGGNGIFWGLDPFGAKTPQINGRAEVAKT
jgi:hypothetical protein